MTFPVPIEPPGLGDPSVHNIPPSQQPHGPSPEQVEAWRNNLFEMILREVLKAVQGFFAPVQSAFDQLVAWAESIPALAPWVEALTGTPGDLTDLTAWAQSLPTLEQLLNSFSEALSPITAWLQSIIDTVTGNIGATLTDLYDWAVSLLKDWGLIPDWLLPLVSTGAVTSQQPNFLINATFDTAASMAGAAPQWSWDGTVRHTSTGGSAKVVPAGQFSGLVSNEIWVVTGQTIQVSSWVKWDSITYMSTYQIHVDVAEYRSGNFINSQFIAGVQSPAATQDWTQFTGEYTVPAGVDQIRLRLVVEAGVSAGTVWFDDATAAKIDLIQDAHAPGIQETVDNIVQQLFGWTGIDFSHADSAAALGGLAGQVVELAAQVEQLRSQGFTGVIAGDDMTRTGSILGTEGLWDTQYGAGYGWYQCDDEVASWHRQWPYGLRSARSRWTGTGNTSNTDYQKIVLTLSSGCEFTSIGNYGAWIEVYGRMSSDFQNYINFSVNSTGGGGAGWELSRIVGGAETTMASGTCTNPGPGSTVVLYCGWSGTLRRFLGVVGGATVCDFTEGGSSSQVGVSYRQWGWGGVANGASGGLTQQGPAYVNQWLAMDQ